MLLTQTLTLTTRTRIRIRTVTVIQLILNSGTMMTTICAGVITAMDTDIMLTGTTAAADTMIMIMIMTTTTTMMMGTARTMTATMITTTGLTMKTRVAYSQDTDADVGMNTMNMMIWMTFSTTTRTTPITIPVTTTATLITVCVMSMTILIEQLRGTLEEENDITGETDAGTGLGMSTGVEATAQRHAQTITRTHLMIWHRHKRGQQSRHDGFSETMGVKGPRAPWRAFGKQSIRCMTLDIGAPITRIAKFDINNLLG